MTGRELICYILVNHLEDEPICKEGHILGFESIEKAAERLDVGPATVKAWYESGNINGVTIDGKIYILSNSQPNKKIGGIYDEK